jgi:DNA invertase Pin-like site-specific DNA recombinase
MAQTAQHAATSPKDNPAGGRRGGRKALLDEAKRWQVVALITAGFSRRMAAREVGCAGSTITRTAARDPEFARQLAEAEEPAREKRKAESGKG